MMITPDTPHIGADKVILTGRLKAGKDYVAEHSGHTVYGFADPIYEITNYFIGTNDKEVPGARRFMQKVGAWGRAEVSEDYPRTAERWRIEEEVRDQGEHITGIAKDCPEVWNGFGIRDDFWIEILSMRIENAEEDRIAITNGRFPNEIKRFFQMGFAHRHIMCSEETRKERLEDAGETYDPDAETDVTEQLAHELDELAKSDTPLMVDDPDGMLRQFRNDSITQAVWDLDSVVWNDDPSKMPAALQTKAGTDQDKDQDEVVSETVEQMESTSYGSDDSAEVRL